MIKVYCNSCKKEIDQELMGKIPLKDGSCIFFYVGDEEGDATDDHYCTNCLTAILVVILQRAAEEEVKSEGKQKGREKK